MKRIFLYLGWMLFLCSGYSAHADNLLKNVPFDAGTDLPKLSAGLNVPEAEILLYAPGQYSQMDGWAPNSDIHLFRRMLFVLTSSGVIFATWDEANKKFKAYYSFRDKDISDMAMYDGKPSRQIQLSTIRGFLSVNLLNTPPFMNDESDDLSQTSLAAFELLKLRNIPLIASRGYVKVSSPTRLYFFEYHKKR